MKKTRGNAAKKTTVENTVENVENMVKNLKFAFGMAVAFFMLPADVVDAETLTVTTTSMDVADDGFCSLPEAIVSANTNVASGEMKGECPAGAILDLIQLGSSETYVLTSVLGDIATHGDHGLPTVTADFITLEGNGSTITREPEAADFRLLGVSGRNFVVRDVHFDNGIAESYGGGVLITSDATVESCTFTGNMAGVGGGGIAGVFTVSNMTIRDSSFSTNQGGTWGGGVYVGGTGLVENSHFEQNDISGSGGSGAGVGGNGNSLVISNSTFTGNLRGAIQFGHGDAEVRDSVIWGNSGHYSIFGDSGSNMQVINTTVTMNSGFFSIIRFVVDGAINNSTVYGNFSRGLQANTPPNIEVSNSIIAHNSLLGDCEESTFASLGHNLDSDGTCGFSATGDLSAMDPRLVLELGADGRPLLVPAPLSPVIDAGSAATVGSVGACEPLDQRGVARPVDGGGDAQAICDMGALEAPHQLFTDGFESGDMSAWSL